MTDLSDPNQLELVLEALGANNTAIIREAESVLKPFLKKIACLPLLLRQIEYSTKVFVRHISALILKKRINVLYSHCSNEDKNIIKETLLRLLVSEGIKVIRTAIAGAVAALAKNVLSTENAWPQLFDLLLQLVQNPQESMRSLCFNLLGQLTELVPEFLKLHVDTILQMLLAGCADSSQDVASSAISAATTLISVLSDEEEVMKLQPLLTPILEVVNRSLQLGLEDIVIEAFDMFQECAAMSQPLINDHIAHIIPFAIHILRTTTIDTKVRNAASNTVLHIVEYRPNLIGKTLLVEPIFAALLEMIATTDKSAIGGLFQAGFGHHNKSDDDDDDEGEVNIQEASQVCMDKMAQCIPSKLFVPPVLALCSQYLASPDPRHRKAGCTALAVIAEGCADTIRASLDEILPVIIKCIYDSNAIVRECSCFAIGQFSEHCQPEILYHHQTIFPALFAALDDQELNVQCTSCYVLENFCENLLVPTLRPVLATLVSKLSILMNRGVQAQEMALLALSSAAIASEIEFLPYVQATVNMLEQFIFLSEPEFYNLRGRALECLGHVAIAVGGDHFQQYFDLGMRSALQGTQMKDEMLQEYGYIFIANCAKSMGSRLSGMLDDIVPHLIEVIVEPELYEASDNEEEGLLSGLKDDDDDEEEDEHILLNTEEGFICTKKAAISALGSLAEFTGAAFFPYVEKSLTALLSANGATDSYHRTIRSEGLIVMQFMVKVVCASQGPKELPPKGVSVELSNIVAYVVKVVCGTYLNVMGGDCEKEPVASALEGFNGVLETVGLVALSIQSEDQIIGNVLMLHLKALLDEKTQCQVINKHEQEDDEDDEGDHDLILDAVVDLIGTLAKVIGAGFAPYFDPFFSPIMKYTKESRPHSDRAAAIGCLGEVIAYAGPIIGEKYAGKILPRLHDWLGDKMETVRRNASYLVGVLCENATSIIVPSYGTVLQLLHPLCLRPAGEILTDTGGADVDNALSAVARMIKMAPAAVPLQLVLPVLIASLPIRSDFGESASIYGSFCSLLNEMNPVALQFLSDILKCFAICIANNEKDETEARVLIVSCLLFLVKTHQNVLLAALNQIPDPNIQAILQNAIISTNSN